MIKTGNSDQLLERDLVEQVLSKLGVSQAPSADLNGLSQIYAAWCRKMPFDNVRKLIHVTARDSQPLPGDTADDYFKAWLKHGTGGTCWSTNGAWHALLTAVGFNAVRGIATMLVAPTLPPNHGTVIVNIDGTDYWVDSSIHHEIPLPLDPQRLDESNARLRFKAQLRHEGGSWILWWLPLHRLQGLDCRIDSFPATQGDFQSRHEKTREWSPFNYELSTRKIIGDKAVGIGLGNLVELDPDGQHAIRKIESAEERIGLLVDKLGYSEEIARAIPQDKQTPPPPMAMRG